MEDNMGKDVNDVRQKDYGRSTMDGVFMKSDQKQIVTGMDKLVNPKSGDTSDQIFDSSASRDINTGSVKDMGGIDYKGIKKGSGGIFR